MYVYMSAFVFNISYKIELPRPEQDHASQTERPLLGSSGLQFFCERMLRNIVPWTRFVVNAFLCLVR